MKALRRIGLAALAASTGMVVQAACLGHTLSLGDAAIVVSPTIIANTVGSCPSGYAHQNACCADGGCREYTMSPFSPCVGDGAVLFADPSSACCNLDGAADCLDAGAVTGSCFYECDPESAGDCLAVVSQGCATACEESPEGGSFCLPSSCAPISTCTCPGASWPATSNGQHGADGSTVCCLGDGSVCFSVAVGPVSSGSGSGTSGFADAGEVGPSDAETVFTSDDGGEPTPSPDSGEIAGPNDHDGGPG